MASDVNLLNTISVFLDTATESILLYEEAGDELDTWIRGYSKLVLVDVVTEMHGMIKDGVKENTRLAKENNRLKQLQGVQHA
jgi:hypothetical protein